MRYRMIIADDEEMLIQLIKKLGRFEELGIDIIDECHDGEEAYNSIIAKQPDFVLTDIHMPVLDGLEMVAKIQNDAPDVLFVLLSGYRYFEYARSAIQLSVVDYLLKPVDEDQLNALLERLCRLTDERRREKKNMESLESIRDLFVKRRYNDFWNMLLTSGTCENPPYIDAETIKRDHDITFPHACFRVLALKYSLVQLSETGLYSFIDKLNETVSAAFGGKVIYCPYQRGDQYLVLLNFCENDVNLMRTATTSFFYSCKDLHDIFGDFRLTLGQSDIKRSATLLLEAVKEAQAASWGWLYFSSDQIVSYDQVRKMPRINILDAISDAEQQQLFDSVQCLRADVLAEVFSALKQFIAATPYIYPEDFERLYGIIRQQVGNGAVEDRREELLRNCDDALNRAWDISQAIQSIYTAIGDYITDMRSQLEKAGIRPVRRAQEYIHQNYAQSISLETAAEAAGITSAYLSKVFKEINGIGFNDYLTDVRLEESKRLLSDTNMSVREIAANVGYCDEKYYSKLFKKQFAIKPTEYRKLYG